MTEEERSKKCTFFKKYNKTLDKYIFIYYIVIMRNEKNIKGENKMETKTFKSGETYSTRSVCDYNCIFEYKVIKRTAKTITIISKHDEKKVCRIYIYDGIESVKPQGSYSMAPILRAE